MRKVIRAILNGEDIATCNREESFEDIYDALGDSPAQESIRRSTPEKLHCKLLTNPRYGPSFCLACPNNPYLPIDPSTQRPNPRVEILQLAEQYGLLAEDALRLALRFRYGLSVPLESYIEQEVLLIAAEELERARAQQQGEYIAARIGEILAAMFGYRR